MHRIYAGKQNTHSKLGHDQETGGDSYVFNALWFYRHFGTWMRVDCCLPRYSKKHTSLPIAVRSCYTFTKAMSSRKRKTISKNANRTFGGDATSRVNRKIDSDARVAARVAARRGPSLKGRRKKAVAAPVVAPLVAAPLGPGVSPVVGPVAPALPAPAKVVHSSFCS